MKALRTGFLSEFYLRRLLTMEFYLLQQITDEQRGLRRLHALSCSILYSFPERGALCDGTDVISLTCGSRRPVSADPVISLRSREHLPGKVHITANEKSHYSVAEHIKHHFSFYCFLGIPIQSTWPKTYENVELNITLKIFFSYNFHSRVCDLFSNQTVCHTKSTRPENLQEKSEKAALK